MSFKTYITSLLLLFSIPVSAVTSYLGAEKVEFLGSSYNLAWSSKMQNGSIIEDFIPKGPSYTQFEKKFSVYCMKNSSFEKLFMEKQRELEEGKQEGSILEFKNSVLNKDEIMCYYVSELVQDGVSLIVQYTCFRYVRSGKDVLILEWQHRSYKDAESFKKRIEKNKEQWKSALASYKIYNLISEEK